MSTLSNKHVCAVSLVLWPDFFAVLICKLEVYSQFLSKAQIKPYGTSPVPGLYFSGYGSAFIGRWPGTALWEIAPVLLRRVDLFRVHDDRSDSLYPLRLSG
jgi:hypothetical protein